MYAPLPALRASPLPCLPLNPCRMSLPLLPLPLVSTHLVFLCLLSSPPVALLPPGSPQALNVLCLNLSPVSSLARCLPHRPPSRSAAISLATRPMSDVPSITRSCCLPPCTPPTGAPQAPRRRPPRRRLHHPAATQLLYHLPRTPPIPTTTSNSSSGSSLSVVAPCPCDRSRAVGAPSGGTQRALAGTAR